MSSNSDSDSDDCDEIEIELGTPKLAKMFFYDDLCVQCINKEQKYPSLELFTQTWEKLEDKTKYIELVKKDKERCLAEFHQKETNVLSNDILNPILSSPLLFFVKEQRPIFRVKHPDMPYKKCLKALEKLWIQCSDKSKYIEEYSKNIVEVCEQIKAKEAEEAQRLKEEPKEEPEPYVHKSRDKPHVRKPLSAYIYFTQEQRPILKEIDPNMDFRTTTLTLGSMWKQLEDISKSKYIELAKQGKNKYQLECIEKGVDIKE